MIVRVLRTVDAWSQSIPANKTSTKEQWLRCLLSKREIIELERVTLIRLHPYRNMSDSYQGKSWLHTARKCFLSLNNHPSVTTFIHGLLSSLFSRCQSFSSLSLSLFFVFAFISNGSSLSALSPRRVKKGNENEIDRIFCLSIECLVDSCSTAKKCGNRASLFAEETTREREKPEVGNQMGIWPRDRCVFVVSKLQFTHLN